MVTTRSKADKAEVEAAYAEATSNDSTNKIVKELRTTRTTTSNNDTACIDILTENVAALNVDEAPKMEEEEVFDPITTVSEFCHLIATTPADQWKKRTAALESLVAVLSGNNQLLSYEESSQMAIAVSALLRDPRSSVVKLACASLKKLYAEIISPPSNLLFQMVPTILEVAALTSAVIRQQVQDMTKAVMAVCPCVEAIPLILQPLDASNKSKTVRESCVVYLTCAVSSWKEALNHENLAKVGNQLIASMRDSMPAVRDQARTGVEILRKQFPQQWEQMVKSNCSGRDLKLQKLLEKSLEQPNMSLEKLMSSKSTAGTSKTGPSKFSKFRQFQMQQQKQKQQEAIGTSNVTTEEKKTDDVLVL